MGRRRNETFQGSRVQLFSQTLVKDIALISLSPPTDGTFKTRESRHQSLWEGKKNVTNSCVIWNRNHNNGEKNMQCIRFFFSPSFASANWAHGVQSKTRRYGLWCNSWKAWRISEISFRPFQLHLPLSNSLKYERTGWGGGYLSVQQLRKETLRGNSILIKICFLFTRTARWTLSLDDLAKISPWILCSSVHEWNAATYPKLRVTCKHINITDTRKTGSTILVSAATSIHSGPIKSIFFVL